MRKLFVYLVVLALAGFTAGFALVQTRVNKEVRARVDKAIAGLAPLGKIQYGLAYANLWNRDVRITDIRVKPAGTSDTLTAGALVLEGLMKQPRESGRLDFSILDIRLDPEASFFGPAGYHLKRMGYEALSADLDGSLVYDGKEKKLQVEKLDVEIKDMGRLSVNLVLSNLDLANQNLSYASFAYVLSQAERAGLKEAEFTYEDDLFFDRYFELRAWNEAKTARQVKEEEIRALDEMILAEPTPSGRDMFRSLKRFFNSPETLKLSLGPPAPVPLKNILAAHPSRLPKILGLEVSP